MFELEGEEQLRIDIIRKKREITAALTQIVTIRRAKDFREELIT